MAAAPAPDAAGDPEDADFRRLMELAHGFMGSQVLFTALDLGLFEALAPGPLDAASAARVLGLSPHGTRLLLDACACLGLLRREEEEAGPGGGAGGGAGAYALAPPSRELLLAGGARTQRAMLLYLGAAAYGAWGRGLGGAVREGRSPQRPRGGDDDDAEEAGPFAAIYRTEAERLSFMRALQDTWRVSGGRVLTAFDLSPFRVICDVGGGSGALAAACARLYPGSAVCVFDTPGVVAAARAHFPPPAGAPPPTLHAGDFFRSRLPPADLYVLARVLHDWEDEACARLLGRIRAAGGPGAAVLLVEALLAEGGRGPLPALLLSLNVLLQTGGRERTERQYRDLCARAGFPRFRCRRTGGAYDVMLARK